MGSQWTESYWEGNLKQIINLHISSFSSLFSLCFSFVCFFQYRTEFWCFYDYRLLPMLFHCIGNPTMVFLWLMISRASTLKKQYLALPSQKMTHTLCLPVVERFLYLTWWHSRCVSEYTTLIFHSFVKFIDYFTFFIGNDNIHAAASCFYLPSFPSPG